MIEPQEFEGILNLAIKQLNAEVRSGTLRYDPKGFQQRVMEVVAEAASGRGVIIAPTFHEHAFPDIRVNGFGIEVKTTNQPSWLSVGNSVFEGMRDPTVKSVHVVFGKFGGSPAVRWGRYEDVVTHVRISHGPRFVIEMADQIHPPLFRGMDVDYATFSGLSAEEKMRHIRAYTRKRLNPGETIWWLDEKPPEENALPLEIKIYTKLDQAQKRKLRAEAALLCPEVVGSSRRRDKYTRAALYILTRYGIYCPQARDLFSAGSTAGKARGGNYVMRSLRNIEKELLEAAEVLDSRVVEEYWGVDVAPEKRVAAWLQKADSIAKGWKPSEELFKDIQS